VSIIHDSQAIVKSAGLQVGHVRAGPQDLPMIRNSLDNGIKSGRIFSSAYAGGTLLPGGFDVKRLDLEGYGGDPGVRGVIWGFSASSRRTATRRLMGMPLDDLAAPDKYVHEHNALFVTLTYPGEWPRDWHEYKADLRAFIRRVERCPWLGYKGLFWKLEQQKRGAPHFHILLVLEKPVSVTSVADWARRAWFDVVGSGDLRHLRHGADVRVIYRINGGTGLLMRYLTKYMAKTWWAVDGNGEPVETGRTWGVCGDMESVVTCNIAFVTRLAWVEFQRRVRRWGRKSPYLACLANAYGLRLFGGIELLQLVRGLDFGLGSVIGTQTL